MESSSKNCRGSGLLWLRLGLLWLRLGLLPVLLWKLLGSYLWRKLLLVIGIYIWTTKSKVIWLTKIRRTIEIIRELRSTKEIIIVIVVIWPLLVITILWSYLVLSIKRNPSIIKWIVSRYSYLRVSGEAD